MVGNNKTDASELDLFITAEITKHDLLGFGDRFAQERSKQIDIEQQESNLKTKLRDYNQGFIPVIAGMFDSLKIAMATTTTPLLAVRTSSMRQQASREDTAFNRWMVNGIHSTNGQTTIFLSNTNADPGKVPSIKTNLDDEDLPTDVERQGEEVWITYKGPAAISFEILALEDGTYQLDLFTKEKF